MGLDQRDPRTPHSSQPHQMTPTYHGLGLSSSCPGLLKPPHPFCGVLFLFCKGGKEREEIPVASTGSWHFTLLTHSKIATITSTKAQDLLEDTEVEADTPFRAPVARLRVAGGELRQMAMGSYLVAGSNGWGRPS